MASFNSNLNNLFKNFQQQQQYAKKAFDVNGDGKINGKDKTALTSQESTIKKNKNLFDVNGDGKFNQTDVDMFVKGDVNGDGKITQDELNFVSKYKKDFKKKMVAQKADFVIDGIKYVKGKKFTGIADGKYYKKGKLATGTYKKKYYVNGNLANGIYNKILYKNGVKYTGIHTDGKYYKNGKLYSGTVDGARYKKGVLQYKIVDNNKNTLPNASGSKIKFNKNSNGKYVYLQLNIGETAVINSNNNVVVTSKDGKTSKCYDKNGNLFSTITNANTTGVPSISGGNGIKYANGKVAYLNNGENAIIYNTTNVVITSKDGRTLECYNKNGEHYRTIINNNASGQKPCVSGGNGIMFTTGKVEYLSGKKIVINANKTVTVLMYDGKTQQTYDASGKLISTGTATITSSQPTHSPVNARTETQPSHTAIQTTAIQTTTVQYPYTSGRTLFIDEDIKITMPAGATMKYDADNGTVSVISSDKKTTTIYDEMTGEKMSETVVNGSTTTVQKFEDNKLVEKLITNKDGSREEYKYDSNGKVEYELKMAKNGTINEISYNNGIIIKKQSITNAGKVVIEEYDNGKIYSRETYDTNQDVTTEEFENGKLVYKELNKANGTYAYWEYDENGKQIESGKETGDETVAKKFSIDIDLENGISFTLAFTNRKLDTSINELYKAALANL